MRLIGSKMEREYREELINSRLFHFSWNSQSRLKQALDAQGDDTSNAYVIDWIPEQAEDIYLVLIDGSELRRVELQRLDTIAIPVIERLDLNEYKLGLKRAKQVKLLVAQDLARTKT